MPEAAKFYGLQITRSGMACCPFHEDGKPSMKIYEDHYYCFGCGATGDCTGFVSKLFGISQLDAAKKISHDFGLNLFNGEIAVPVNERVRTENNYHVWLRNARATVTEYLHRLDEWRRIYKPINQSEQLNPLFVESLQKTSYIEYLADLLSYGTEQEKRDLYKINSNTIMQIQKRLDKLAAVKEHTVKHKLI